MNLSLFPEYDEIHKHTLVIIGNGFDLAHGIESSYGDFHHWLRANNLNNLVDMLDIFFSKEESVWKDIEKALGQYDEKAILDYCRPDEEFDMDHSLSSSARIEDSPMVFFQPVLGDFRKAFAEWVDRIEISDVERVCHLDPRYKYLTFNYTDTLESVYQIPRENICHIHGNRLMKDDYVIGHNNYRDPSEVWNEDGLIFEEQACEDIISWMNDFVKCHSDNIARNREFFNDFSDITQIITYGHSLSEIDWSYFEEIIHMVGKDVPWRISCFSADDYANTAKFQCRYSLTKVETFNMKTNATKNYL